MVADPHRLFMSAEEYLALDRNSLLLHRLVKTRRLKRSVKTVKASEPHYMLVIHSKDRCQRFFTSYLTRI
jgi:hypothetical protein